jgi:hypothetical protein
VNERRIGWHVFIHTFRPTICPPSLRYYIETPFLFFFKVYRPPCPLILLCYGIGDEIKVSNSHGLAPEAWAPPPRHNLASETRSDS